LAYTVNNSLTVDAARAGARKPLIRIDATPAGNFTAFEVRRDGELVLATLDAVEVAQHLLGMGIEDPMALVKGAVQWGAVEIREAAAGD
jgi:hypothetical protein